VEGFDAKVRITYGLKALGCRKLSTFYPMADAPAFCKRKGSAYGYLNFLVLSEDNFEHRPEQLSFLL